MFNSLVLVITDKCTASCDICMYECSPQKNKKMSIEDAYRYIEEAKKVSSIEKIGISGGEPLIYPEDVKKIIQKSVKSGFKAGLITNGFWAADEENCRATMLELRECGLSSMEVSTDDFHLKYIPLKNIANIVKINHEAALDLEINMAVTKSSTKKEELIVGLQRQGVDCSGIKINEVHCVPVGRARNAIDAEEILYAKEVPRECCTGQKNLAIYPDGMVYPCCRHSVVKSEILKIDSAKKFTIEEISDRSNRNPCGMMLKVFGTGWFLDAIEDNHLPIPISERYVSECGVCDDILRYKEYEELYLPLIKKEIQNRS